MANSATINTEQALDCVKQVNEYVKQASDRTKLFKDKVDGVFARTNMPFVSQLLDLTTDLATSMTNVKDAANEILSVMEKYTEEVNDIAESMDGLPTMR